MDPTPNIGERWLRCLWVIAFLRGAEFRNGYINASIGKIGIANKEQARVNDANAALVGPYSPLSRSWYECKYYPRPVNSPFTLYNLTGIAVRSGGERLFPRVVSGAM